MTTDSTTTDATPRDAKRPGRTAFLTVGLTLAAASVAYLAYLSSDFLARKTTMSQVSVAFPDEPIQSIKLDLSAGSIRLRVGEGTDVTGTRKVRSGLRSPTYSERRGNDGTLTLVSDCPKNSPVCSVDYDLFVPANVKVTGKLDGGAFESTGIEGDMKFDSSGGSISVTDTKGTIEVASSGGDVSSVRSSGTLILESSGGAVSAVDAAGKRITADSSGGSVTAIMTTPPSMVNVSSSGGAVTVVVPEDDTSYQVDASSSGGDSDVVVRTDPNSTSTIKARSSGGNVTVRYPTQP